MRSLLVLSLLGGLAAMPPSLAAQGATPPAARGVVVKSVTDTHLFGALGAIASVAAKLGGPDLREIPSTTSIAGHRLRLESKDFATIVDVDAGRLTQVDHKQRTYRTMTFEQIAAAMKEAAESAKQKTQQSRAEEQKKGSDSVDVQFHVSVEPTGKRQKIAGYDAEQVFITLTADVQAKPEGESKQEAGSIVFLVEQWQAANAPQLAAMTEFQHAYAEKAGTAFRQPMDALRTALATNPQLLEGFDAIGKEMAKHPGVSLRTVTYAVLVPPELKFDRQQVLAEAAAVPPDKARPAEKPKKGGLRGLFGAIKSAAEQSAKSSEASKSETDKPHQATLVEVRDEVQSITQGMVPGETFVAPAGYRALPPPGR